MHQCTQQRRPTMPAYSTDGRRLNDNYDDVRRMERSVCCGKGPVTMVLPPDAEADRRIAESCRRGLVKSLRAAGIDPADWGVSDGAT